MSGWEDFGRCGSLRWKCGFAKDILEIGKSLSPLRIYFILKILLSLLILLAIVSCATQKPDPYEEAGYVRFGGGRPHVLPSQPQSPYRGLDYANEIRRRIIQQQQQQYMQNYYRPVQPQQ